jgi:hypothetical protein
LLLKIVVSLEESPGEGISAKPEENVRSISRKRQKVSSLETLGEIATTAGAATIATSASAIKKSCIVPLLQKEREALRKS